MEKHRADPNCASCHSRMDPLGFALENFDAIGGYRDKDGDVPGRRLGASCPAAGSSPGRSS